MAGIFDGVCDDHYTLTITMCKRSHQPCIGKIQCDRLRKIAHEIETSDNALADGIHDALAYYDRSLFEVVKTIAKTGVMSEVTELIDLDERLMESSPSCTSLLLDQYRAFVNVYINNGVGYHEREHIMTALKLLEKNMQSREIPVPLSTAALVSW